MIVFMFFLNVFGGGGGLIFWLFFGWFVFVGLGIIGLVIYGELDMIREGDEEKVWERVWVEWDWK